MAKTNFDFTDKEKVYISETLNIVIEDLEKIVSLYPIPFHTIEIDNLQLSFGSTYIYLKESNAFNNISLSTIKGKGYKDEEKSKKPKRVNFPALSEEEQNNVARFLANYEAYRNQAIEKLQEVTENKKDLFNKLQALRVKYSNEVSVDFGEIPTQNIKTLEVTKENGRSIGTIDFGSRIVKIITDGDIVLKKVEPVKEKVKRK